MVTDLSSTLIDYLTAGDIFNYFVVLFNQYFPYGIFFWITGFILFSIMYLKTKSIGYGGIFLSLYFVVISHIPNLVVSAYVNFAMKYAGIMLGLISGYYIYNAIKGRR